MREKVGCRDAPVSANEKKRVCFFGGTELSAYRRSVMFLKVMDLIWGQDN